jgi:hypothetical protein
MDADFRYFNIYYRVIILTSPDAPFWVLGLFLAVDILFQGINYLSLASAIKHLPHSSTTSLKFDQSLKNRFHRKRIDSATLGSILLYLVL